MKKTFTTTKENIVELGYEESNQTSSDSVDSSGNRHFQFHNKPSSFNGTRKFNTDPEDSVNIPVVTTPTGAVLHQSFEEWNRKVMFKKSQVNSINFELRKIILLYSQSTIEGYYPFSITL